LIETAGYEVEVHRTETQDGYKLKMHRILPKKISNSPRLGPVFVMHGLFGTAADPIMTGADIALRKVLS
jgi:lysosomal acid lipase/cholesteryl ester hydrolase